MSQFKDQGGAATMDPSSLRRWGQSKLLSFRFSEQQVNKRRAKAERRRRAASRPHLVEYFHQIDDPYSHLAAQLLARFAARYGIELRCHLVRGPEGHNVFDPELLGRLARYDAALIAPHYGLAFPKAVEAPEQALVELASSILATLNATSLTEHIGEVSEALWTGDVAGLERLAEQLGRVDAQAAVQRLAQGTRRRAELKHYSGGMFHYEGEWYWGVDRLHYLEARLSELGLDGAAGAPPLAPCPAVDLGAATDCADLTLEFYPSLRSPYTAIVFDETVALAQRAGVDFRVRPVLPMVMRGVPVTLDKGFYIFFDTAREARRRGVPYGAIYDPIGAPVRRCYSIYPWAVTQGRGTELLSSFLHHAFAKGVNTNRDKGLREVVEAAGLPWSESEAQVGEAAWEELLEGNRLAMHGGGLWGVPSYRLLAPSGDPLLEVWGQDRLWLVAQEIRRYQGES